MADLMLYILPEMQVRYRFFLDIYTHSETQISLGYMASKLIFKDHRSVND